MSVNVFSQPGGRNLVYPANSSTARTQQQAANNLGGASSAMFAGPQGGQVYGGLQQPDLMAPQFMGPNNATDPNAAATGAQASQPAAPEAPAPAPAPAPAKQTTPPEQPSERSRKPPQDMPRIHIGNSQFLAQLRGKLPVFQQKMASDELLKSATYKLLHHLHSNENVDKEAAFVPAALRMGQRILPWMKRIWSGTPKVVPEAAAATSKAVSSVKPQLQQYGEIRRLGQAGASQAATTAAPSVAAVAADAAPGLGRRAWNTAKSVGGNAMGGSVLGFGADTAARFATGEDPGLGGYGMLGGAAYGLIPSKYRQMIRPWLSQRVLTPLRAQKNQWMAQEDGLAKHLGNAMHNPRGRIAGWAGKGGFQGMAGRALQNPKGTLGTLATAGFAGDMLESAGGANFADPRGQMRRSADRMSQELGFANMEQAKQYGTDALGDYQYQRTRLNPYIGSIDGEKNLANRYNQGYAISETGMDRLMQSQQPRGIYDGGNSGSIAAKPYYY